MREALFARLGDLDGVRALDLFGGSGALGIEALSRGASYVAFVERAVPVAAVLQANLVELGLAGRSHVVRGDAAGVVRRLAAAGERFDLALLDPPYADPESANRTLRALATSGILAPRATVVVEASRRHPPQQVEELEAVDERRYGDTVIHRFEYAPGFEYAAERKTGTSLEPPAAEADEARAEDEETA